MARFIELSHIIEGGMVTYTGLPGPVISDHMSREDAATHYTEGTTLLMTPPTARGRLIPFCCRPIFRL